MKVTSSLVVAFIIAGVPSVSALWVLKEVSSVAAQSPVIISGEIVKIDRGRAAKQAFDTAFIRVASIEKNDLRDVKLAVGDDFPVLMNGINSRMGSSLDITYPIGTKARWLVYLENDGRFYINQRPEQRQPLGDALPALPPTMLSINADGSEGWTKAEWIAEMKRQQKAEEEQAKRWREHRERVARLISAVEVDGTFQASALAAIDAADFETRKDVVNLRARTSKLSLASYTKLQIHLLEHDPHASIQALAASRLGYDGDVEMSRAPLLKALTSELQRTRLFACQALKFHKDKRAAPGVVALLADEHKNVRRMAATTLGWLGGAEHIAGIMTVLEADDFELGELISFTDALARLGETEVALRLATQVLDEGGGGSRRAALRCLTLIQSPEAVTLLVKNLAPELERALARPAATHAFDDVFKENVVELEKRTKQGFGADIVRWHSWLATTHRVELNVNTARCRKLMIDYRARKSLN